MQLTPEQVKGRIKNVAKENKADARTLMRIYMMERFLERVANSQYKDNFIIKGGMLVTAMVGVALRSTMDIDTSIKNQNLSAEDAKRIVDDIKDIDLGDGVTFEVKEVSNIMDEMEYPGIRFTMNAVMGKLVTPMKIDISTGDVITPRAIEYKALHRKTIPPRKKKPTVGKCEGRVAKQRKRLDQKNRISEIKEAHLVTIRLA